MKAKQPSSVTTSENYFEKQVLKLCNTAAEPIVHLYHVENEYPNAQIGKTITAFLSSFSAIGIKIEVVQAPDKSDSKLQDEYHRTEIILKFTATDNQEIYIKINCCLSSYGGLEYTSHKQVFPVTKTVQLFE